MEHVKTNPTRMFAVKNLKGDTFHVLADLVEMDSNNADANVDLCPSPLTDSMEKAWDLYWDALLKKLETDDPTMEVPDHYMQHIMKLHNILNSDLEYMDAERQRFEAARHTHSL